MRTTPANPMMALLLCLLAPLLALAQGAEPAQPLSIRDSPLFWYWVVVLTLAVALFIWRSVAISRRRGPPRTPTTHPR